MNLLIVLPCCGHKLLLATVIIALTLIPETLGYRRKNELRCGEGTEEEHRVFENTDCTIALFTRSHRREPGILVNGTPSQWISEFAPNTDSSITFARLSTLINKIILITFEKIAMLWKKYKALAPPSFQQQEYLIWIKMKLDGAGWYSNVPPGFLYKCRINSNYKQACVHWAWKTYACWQQVSNTRITRKQPKPFLCCLLTCQSLFCL